MTLSEELTWRGFVNQTTLSDIKALDNTQRTFYWGCDPSSDSLQIGNLAAAMMARVFIQHGYTPVLLVGGATGMVGDPKDDEERQLKSLEEIETNKKAIAAQYKQIFSGLEFKLVDNYDWFKDIGYLQFLRDVGKHTSMSQMLDREFVKARVGEDKVGLSYAEFSYALIQGYDFLHLYRHHEVTLQLCGSDQWGNSVAGVDLIRRLESGEAHVWSAPLVVNKVTGKKFGKSEEGAIWLDENKTSVFQFYQFWLNVDDEGVIDYLKIYSQLTKSEIDELEKLTNSHPERREAQKALALDVTKTVHGEKRAESVKKVSDVLFGSGSFSELNSDDLKELAKEIPTIEAKTITEALIQSKLVQSNSEARRLLQSGAIAVNGEKVSPDGELGQFTPVHGHLLLRRGKNSFALVKSK